MSLDIKNFREEVIQNGFLKTNRFLVEFQPPNTLKGRSTNAVSLRCDSIQWPGVSFATMDTPPRAGYGATELIPYAPIFDDITMNFIVDQNSNLHQFFWDWTNSIINLDSKGQTRLKQNAFTVGYKNEYKTDIDIKVFRDTGVDKDSLAMKATLYRAFPRMMPSFDLNWVTTDEPLKISVQFSYTDFYIEYPKPVESKPKPA
jgi:hypothetical protein